MEGITEGVKNISVTETQKKNRIQVSNTKKSLFFYVNLSKVLFFLPVYLLLLYTLKNIMFLTLLLYFDVL